MYPVGGSAYPISDSKLGYQLAHVNRLIFVVCERKTLACA